MKKKLNKKYLVFVAICLIVVAGVFIRSNLQDKQAAAESAGQMTTVEIKKSSIEVKVSGTGNVTAVDKRDVKPQTNGTVDRIFVEEGQVVNQGDLIITLESDSYNLNLEYSKVSTAEAELAKLENDKKGLKIYAPVDGIIGTISPKVGDDLAQGSVLTTITDKAKIEVTAGFNSSQISRLKVGEKVEVYLPDYIQSVTGTVTKIGDVGRGNGTLGILYDVEVQIDNPGALTPGTEAIVILKDGTKSLDSTGLQWKTDEKVKSSVGGTLVKLHVSDNEAVKKGQLIAELENSSLDIQIENQRNKVEQSRLDLNNKVKVIDNLAVYAPITGTVIALNLNEGENVQTNTVIATISDYSALEAIITVDELDVIKLEIGQQAIITSQAIPGEKFTGEVSKIAHEGVAKDGVATFDVTLKVNEPKQLRAGMTINADIVSASKNDALLLPIEAVQQRGDKKIVLLKGGNQEDKPTPREVKLGLVTENTVEITEGVKEGDVVVYSTFIKNTKQNGQSRSMIPTPGMGGQRPPRN